MMFALSALAPVPGFQSSSEFLAFLFAAQSLTMLISAGLWLRVWLLPDLTRINVAALGTAASFIVGGFRLAAAVVFRTGI